ncbi:AraC family transcriptional regulator ligand-binding domain-containing protein [Sphingomonas sp. UYP23]
MQRDIRIPTAHVIHGDTPPDKCRLDIWFWQALEGLGVSPAAVLQHARIPIALPRSYCFFTTTQLFAIFDALEHLADDPAIGFRFFEATKKVGTPPWAAAATFAPNFRLALAHVIQFKRHVMPERMYAEEKHGELSIFKEWFYAPSEAASLVDSSFAFLLAILRQGTGRSLSPLRIDLVRRSPGSDLHRAHFGCPVRYDAARNALVLRSSDCDLPFVEQNPQMLDILRPALTSEFQDPQPFSCVADSVKAVLKRSLSTGRPDLAKIAREMGTSERTLQRRITAEGTTFSAITKEARQELGRHLLSDPSMEIGDVAFRLGYQDTTSFYRAFRGWEGETPNQWQARNVGDERSIV